MEKSFKSQDRKVQVVESLLTKPSKKPDFTQIGGSDILKRAAAFMPQFICTTDRLLNDPDFLRKNQMDIDVQQSGVDHEIEEYENAHQEPNTINMEIGVGVFDILNSDFNPQAFVPSSSEPIIKVKEFNQDPNASSSSSDSNDNSNSDDLNYQFDSSSEEEEGCDRDSITTKSTNQQNMRKKPLIQDITQNKKKTLKVKNKRKRERKQ